MDCDAVRDLLGPYLDNELRSPVVTEVEDHLTTCCECTDQLESFRELATDLAWQGPTSVPDTLWTSIERRLDDLSVRPPSRPAFGPRRSVFQRPFAAAAGIVLVVGLGLAGWVLLDGGASRAEASTIDFAVLLDALPLDGAKAFRKFLIQYGAKETSVQSAAHFAPQLNFAVPQSLPGGFQLGSVYTLRFGDNPGVAAEYSRNGEFLGMMFHPPVRREDFGTHKDYPCAIGKHRGRTVEVGPWSLVHLTGPTTCHCVLSKLDLQSELPAVMTMVAPGLPASGAEEHPH